MDNLTAELMLNQHSTVHIKLPENTVLHLINNSFIIDIVNRIHHAKQFKNFIFYISEVLELNNPGGIEFFGKFRQTFPLIPMMFVRSHHDSPHSIRDFISTPSLVLICTPDQNDAIMELAAQHLHSMRWLKTIFIVFPSWSADKDYKEGLSRAVTDVLNWSWTKQFTNSLLLTVQNNIYLLNPYPTPKIVNRTNHWSTRHLFRDSSSSINTNGYVIRSPVLNDMPRVFKGADQRTIFGTSANLFLDYLEFINARLVDTTTNLTMKNFDLPYLLDLVSQGVYETLIHSFTDLAGNYSVSISYPIGINDWCIVVPYSNVSFQENYVRDALQDSVWLCLLLAFAYMTCAILLCSPRRPRDLSGSMLQVVCSITNSPPLSILKTPTPRMRALFVLLFIMGLTCSTMYISKMSSYLTSAPNSPQLNTVQDIIDANLRVLVQNYEYDYIAKATHTYPPRFLQQVEVASPEILQRHRDKLNASYAFFVSTDRWAFINMQQRHLTLPIFRLTEICSGPFYHAFPLHSDSHLRQSLQNFILIAQEAGLRYHWKREAFWEALHMHHFRLFVNNEDPTPLSMGFVASIVRTWCLGLVVAGLAFVLEMKWPQIQIIKDCLKKVIEGLRYK